MLTEAALYFAQKWQGQFQSNPLSGGKAPKTEKTTTFGSRSSVGGNLELIFRKLKLSDLKKLTEDLKNTQDTLSIEKRFELICKVHSGTTKLSECLKLLRSGSVSTAAACKQYLNSILRIAGWKKERLQTMHQGGKWKPKKSDLSKMDFEAFETHDKNEKSADHIQKLHSESSYASIQKKLQQTEKAHSMSEKAADSSKLSASEIPKNMDTGSDSKTKAEDTEVENTEQKENKEVQELCEEIAKIFEELDFKQNFKEYLAKLLNNYKSSGKLEKIGDEKNLLNYCFVAAVKRNMVEVAEFLLKEGVDIEFDDEQHGFGNFEVSEDDPEIRFALDTEKEYKSALWYACEFGSPKMVELLLDKKWCSNSRFGCTKHFGILMFSINAFTVAALNKRPDILELLLKYRSKEFIDEASDLALTAGLSGHLDVVKFVISMKSFFKKEKYDYWFGHSCKVETAEEIEALIFTAAAAAGHIDILKFLFERNQNICKLAPYALAEAVTKRQFETVLYLFSLHPTYLNWNSERDPGSVTESEPITAFHHICRFGVNEDLQMAKLLLHLGARIGITFEEDEDKDEKDKPWYELCLLEDCVDRPNGFITEEDEDRLIAHIEEERNLVSAVKNDNLKETQKILASGHSVFARYDGGDTLLHIALYRENLEMALFIWQQGQDYFASAQRCQLPELLSSAFKPHIDLLELTNDDGLDPIDEALKVAVAAIIEECQVEDEEQAAPDSLQQTIDFLTQFFGAALKSLQTDAMEERLRAEKIEKLEKRFKKFTESAQASMKKVWDHGYQVGLPEADIDYTLLAKQFHPKYWLEFAANVSALEITRRDLLKGITEAVYHRFLAKKSLLCELLLDGKLRCKKGIDPSTINFELPNSGLDSISGLDEDDSDPRDDLGSDGISKSNALTLDYSAKRQGAKGKSSLASMIVESSDKDMDLEPRDDSRSRKFS